VTGIDVVEEVFGADDFDIVYNFIATDIDNKCGATNLPNDFIDIIEERIYGRDGYVLGTVLEKGDREDDNEQQ
jgi:hypothetical protein